MRAVLLTAALAWSVSAASAAPKCDRASRPLQVSATTVAFGNYNAASGSATTANGTVTVSCVDSANELPPFSVALSKGSSSTYSPRTMTSGANTLNYDIYTTSGFTSVWGDGTGATVIVSYNGAGNPNSLNFTAFGRIPTSQFVTPGSYTDTITVTVTY